LLRKKGTQKLGPTGRTMGLWISTPKRMRSSSNQATREGRGRGWSIKTKVKKRDFASEVLWRTNQTGKEAKVTGQSIAARWEDRQKKKGTEKH